MTRGVPPFLVRPTKRGIAARIRRAARVWSLATAGILVWLVACGEVVAQPIGGAPGDGGASSSGGEGGGSGGGSDAASDSPVVAEGAPPLDGSSFCTGSGPIPISNAECSGDVARFFRFAACACDSLAVSGALTTQAKDSTADAGEPNGASIAANGQVALNANASVSGSIWAGGQNLTPGTPAVSITSGASTSSVTLDVESGGDVTTSGNFLVGRDLYADGDVTVQSGSLAVVGAVHVPAGDTASGVTSGGGVQNGPVSVAPPCDCQDTIPIASLVSARKTSNDDANVPPPLPPLTTTSLDDPAGTVTLPCGLFYVDGIHGSTAPVTLHVTGRAALFVDGDLDAEAGLTVNLDPAVELDLFVSGNVTLKGDLALGDSGAPAAMRLYVAGSSFTLESSDASVNVNVYAPAADVLLASDFTMRGAIFARSLAFSGAFDITYDTTILETPGCTAPGTPCQTCDDCSGATPACKGGACTACTTDADCCAPLTCVVVGAQGGTCVLPVPNQ